jgi:hypothetical protein
LHTWGQTLTHQPPRALYRARRWALSRWTELDPVSARLLPSRARPLNPIPGRVPRKACCRPQGWAPAVLLRSG